MKRVLVVGEINVDLILQGYHAFPVPGREVLVDDFVMTLGSASAICAMGLARLGRPVAFVGTVGVDLWGNYCLDTLSAAAIDISRVQRQPAVKTGVTVSITSPVDRALVTYLGSTVAFDGTSIDDNSFEGFDHLHISSYFLQQRLRPRCLELFRRATARGLSTSLDPGCDPAERWGDDVRETLAQVDVFLPNEVELSGLTGEDEPLRAARALANGRTVVVGKLGSAGAIAVHGATVVKVPAFPIETVDTTGAGDSFNAGFLHAWLDGVGLAACVRFGAACGALSTRGIGGTSTQPTAEEVARFLVVHP